MSAHVADVELPGADLRYAPAAPVAEASAPFIVDQEERSVIRGVVTAVVMSVPFWSLFGYVVYRLM
jgi:hypothetical protein